MIWKDFIVASRLIVHIHTKMKLDSKLKKRGSHKFANILFYFFRETLFFYSENTFFFKILLFTKFSFKHNSYRAEVNLHEHAKGAISNIRTVHLDRWYLSPLYVSNWFVPGSDLPPLWIELEDSPVNLKTFLQGLVHRRYISNVYEHINSEIH
jgi:hypothetical protein